MQYDKDHSHTSSLVDGTTFFVELISCANTAWFLGTVSLGREVYLVDIEGNISIIYKVERIVQVQELFIVIIQSHFTERVPCLVPSYLHHAFHCLFRFPASLGPVCLGPARRHR